jgi:hypothetical protein
MISILSIMMMCISAGLLFFAFRMRLNSPALLGGSRAYGIPRTDSDIDLLIRISRVDFEQMCRGLNSDEWWSELESGSIKHGKINLICCFTDSQYRVWREGIENLKRRAPYVTRDEAIKEFKRLRTTGY